MVSNCSQRLVRRRKSEGLVIRSLRLPAEFSLCPSTQYLTNLWESDFDSWEDASPAPAKTKSSKADADASEAALAAASARERKLEEELDALRSHCTQSKAQQEQLEKAIAGMQADLEVCLASTPTHTRGHPRPAPAPGAPHICRDGSARPGLVVRRHALGGGLPAARPR